MGVNSLNAIEIFANEMEPLLVEYFIARSSRVSSSLGRAVGQAHKRKHTIQLLVITRRVVRWNKWRFPLEFGYEMR